MTCKTIPVLNAISSDAQKNVRGEFSQPKHFLVTSVAMAVKATRRRGEGVEMFRPNFHHLF